MQPCIRRLSMHAWRMHPRAQPAGGQRRRAGMAEAEPQQPRVAAVRLQNWCTTWGQVLGGVVGVALAIYFGLGVTVITNDCSQPMATAHGRAADSALSPCRMGSLHVALVLSDWWRWAGVYSGPAVERHCRCQHHTLDISVWLRLLCAQANHPQARALVRWPTRSLVPRDAVVLRMRCIRLHYGSDWMPLQLRRTAK